MRSLQVLLLDSRWDLLHLYAWRALLWMPSCTCKGSLRAVGFAGTPASRLRGWDHQDSHFFFRWLREHCRMCWVGILH